MGAKEIAMAFGIGAGASTAIGVAIYGLSAQAQASKIAESMWRCAYDGLRYPDENALLDHIKAEHVPPAPNDPRIDTPPAPLVILSRLPSYDPSMAQGALGLWRIIIDHFREDGTPMFVIQEFLSYAGILRWSVGWCGTGKVEIASSPEGPWAKRGVTCQTQEPDWPVGAFTSPFSPKSDTYLQIPEIGIGPILIWRGKR